MSDPLKTLRDRIDRLDDELLRLVNERADLAHQISSDEQQFHELLDLPVVGRFPRDVDEERTRQRLIGAVPYGFSRRRDRTGAIVRLRVVHRHDLETRSVL